MRKLPFLRNSEKANGSSLLPSPSNLRHEIPANLPTLDLVSDRLNSPRILFMQIRRLRHVHGQSEDALLFPALQLRPSLCSRSLSRFSFPCLEEMILLKEVPGEIHWQCWKSSDNVCAKNLAIDNTIWM
ncbi:hypothetical protein TNCV_3135861 [Trichonephila clavipes]|nr:hypothetical protein TNCV_3135861 [Trichonephila clavipes]